MEKKINIFAICGEFSGESHLSRVVKKLKLLNPDINIYGMGSSLTAAAGMENLIDYKDFSFAGVTQVLMNLSKIFKLRDLVLEKIREIKPDLILMVDYAGFNMQIAKAIRAAQQKEPSLGKIKLIQYIAPQIWASRPYRIKNIKKNIDYVFYTLPFEKDLYEGMAATYVGNPVLESLIEEDASECRKEILQFLGKTEIGENAEIGVPRNAQRVIGIFPGSRGFEVSYTLPLFIKAAREIVKHEKDLVFIIAKAPTISKEKLLKSGLAGAEDLIKIIDGNSIPEANQKLLKAADFLWLCSGTVTLEAALYEKPYFLTYKVNAINFALYKLFRIIDKAGLANIISGKFIIKEFLQDDANSENYVTETLKCLQDKAYREQMLSEFKNLKNILGDYKSSELVARKLISLAEE